VPESGAGLDNTGIPDLHDRKAGNQSRISGLDLCHQFLACM